VLYARGFRFTPRFFHINPETKADYFVDLNNESVDQETEYSTASQMQLQAYQVCDVDLPDYSTISDEEDHRFRLSTSVLGNEQARYAGGKKYYWDERTVELFEALRLQLVNVGPTKLINGEAKVGYPICPVCGGSRSPFESDSTLQEFQEWHSDNCGKEVRRIGLYANVIADSLVFRRFKDKVQAYSIVEALRHGAANVLEMELEDLQILALGNIGEEHLDAALYDPIPGGSGLLEQMLDRWDEVIAEALTITDDCPADCESACVDCLRDYRNMHYSEHLDRRVASAALRSAGADIVEEEIYSEQLAESGRDLQESPSSNKSALDDAFSSLDFPAPEKNVEISIASAGETIVVDYFFDNHDGEGLCILTPDDAREARDEKLQLEIEGYEVEVVDSDTLNYQRQLGLTMVKLAQDIGLELSTDRLNDLSWYGD
jgi:hypothetical protein